MTAPETGKQAEGIAAAWLESNGFRVLERNWRTRWCEIDIVAEKHGVIHFVEVKYRRRPDFGTGFDYITADKSRRLVRSATLWLSRHRASEANCQIDVIAILGSLKPQNVEYLPNALAG